jgi:hypothetical protein
MPKPPRKAKRHNGRARSSQPPRLKRTGERGSVVEPKGKGDRDAPFF